jgi:rSAM/selenodomain-associated transferase 2
MPASSCSITVIIPALNEAGAICQTVATTVERLPGTRVIVVDGGSTDATCALARGAGVDVMASDPGRGVQCHVGALAATTEWLLFLHADTTLPPDAAAVVFPFIANAGAQIATFRLRFDHPGWFLRACGWFTRFDTVFTRFGDQGILIRRAFYHDLGGFPPWPLFEDVALLQSARRRTRIHSLPTAVTTSARRFQANGQLRQQWQNARLLVRYLSGTSPHVLAKKYRAVRCRSGVTPVTSQRQQASGPPLSRVPPSPPLPAGVPRKDSPSRMPQKAGLNQDQTLHPKRSTREQEPRK